MAAHQQKQERRGDLRVEDEKVFGTLVSLARDNQEEYTYRTIYSLLSRK